MAEQRLIDANALIYWLTKATGFRTNCEDCTSIDCLKCIIDEAIKNAPTIEAKPVVHAHWVTEQEAEEINRYDLTYCCSACGHCDWDCTESEGFEYCPNCGAKMDEKENDK